MAIIMVNDGYPLVNIHIAMERSTMLLMGKSTISMAIFNSYVKLPEGIRFFAICDSFIDVSYFSIGCYSS